MPVQQGRRPTAQNDVTGYGTCWQCAKVIRDGWSMEINMSEEFDQFWKAYPKKQGKAAARKKWEMHNLDEKAARIIAHVEVRAKRDKQWLDGYVPMPVTFINQERWDDEYESVAPKRDAVPEREVDPLELSEGVKGVARLYGIDHAGLTENDVLRIVWAVRYGGIHDAQLPDHLRARRAQLDGTWDEER